MGYTSRKLEALACAVNLPVRASVSPESQRITKQEKALFQAATNYVARFMRNPSAEAIGTTRACDRTLPRHCKGAAYVRSGDCLFIKCR